MLLSKGTQCKCASGSPLGEKKSPWNPGAVFHGDKRYRVIIEKGFAVTPCNDYLKWVGMVLKTTASFNSTFRSVCSDHLLKRTVGFNSTFWSVICPDRLLKGDQNILIETSSWNQRFFSEPPQLIRDSRYLVLPQNISISYFHYAKFQILLNVNIAKV